MENSQFGSATNRNSATAPARYSRVKEPAVHVKSHRGAPRGFFQCEAAGLRWLKEAEPAGGARVVDVVSIGRTELTLNRIVKSEATARKAEKFGAALAITHDAGAAAWGSPPDGWDGPGFFGPLDDPHPMSLKPRTTFGEYWANDRLRPALAQLRSEYTTRELAAFDRLLERLHDGDFDTDDSPARVHGDLWWGNVMWDEEGAILIDPAAHGGHREEDLALLGLFGMPHLDRIYAAYEEVHPLPGREERAPLHRLYAVLMHAILFRGKYAEQAYDIAKKYA
ncbi:fructosamine kinase family protein [Corynebacterium sp. H113]|uniref:fructosamine kinase family protein n=1 Tax=Corynebacterium sp. H113 TaxID=3133419 RepID=UPI0030B4F7D9